MKVLVLGTLADLVKKIAEIELSDTAGHDRKHAVRIQTYYKVLDKWPLIDIKNAKAQLRTFIYFFKLNCAKLQNLEVMLEAGAPERYITEYFKIKKNLRKLMEDINKLSLPLLDPAEIEVPDGS